MYLVLTVYADPSISCHPSGELTHTMFSSILRWTFICFDDDEEDVEEGWTEEQEPHAKGQWFPISDKTPSSWFKKQYISCLSFDPASHLHPAFVFVVLLFASEASLIKNVKDFSSWQVHAPHDLSQLVWINFNEQNLDFVWASVHVEAMSNLCFSYRRRWSWSYHHSCNNDSSDYVSTSVFHFLLWG